MFLCDYHVHSHFSFDVSPEVSVDALCRAALERGITDLAVTDHFEACEADKNSWQGYDRAAAYAAVCEARERYRGRLHLTYGIELGQAEQCPEAACKLLSDYPIEFVLASMHSLPGAPDFYFLDFQKLLRDAPLAYVGSMFDRSVDGLMAVLDTLPHVDAIAHLTYMHRYMALCGVDYDFSPHFGKVEALYRRMIKRSVALEINVSTLWKGLGFPMPSEPLLSLYRECGGRLVTVGTDSHDCSHLGDCVERALGCLRSLGSFDLLLIRDGKRETVKI